MQLELRNLNRDIEALEYQLEEKRKALDLLTNVYEQIKATQAAMPRRRTKQPISKMIVKVLTGRKKALSRR
ncbi:MAG: hypothetical protein M5R36_13180 [Deltaproteobacteria bacterium]|nr:hypothetical protein [Deltaproteobacteria bacterium]